jgi:hypothetical protein
VLSRWRKLKSDGMKYNEGSEGTSTFNSSNGWLLYGSCVYEFLLGEQVSVYWSPCSVVRAAWYH